MTNKIVWVIQIVLASYFITGAIYMMSNFPDLGTQWALTTLPAFVWLLIGSLQIMLSIGLIIPQSQQLISRQVSISALGLIVITLLGSVLYSAYVGTTGILWSLIPAMVLAFVVKQRWASPTTR